MKQLLQVLTIVGSWAYAIEGALVFAEDALFFGFVLPGETLVVFCGFLAHQHVLLPELVFVVAALSAVLGDQVGFEIGRRFGPSIRQSRLGGRISPAAWRRAERIVVSRGPSAVFVARWIAILRALVPTTSGTLGMRRTTFALWNVSGGVLWALVWTVVGYLAGASWERAAVHVGEATAAVAIVILAAAVVSALRRAERRDAG